MPKVVLIGAGGHAKVVVEFLKKTTDIEIVGLIEKDSHHIGKKLQDIPVIGTDRQLVSIFNTGVTHALITVGGTGDNTIRKILYCHIKDLGFGFINAIHPTAIISDYARFGDGNTIMAGAMIGPDTIIGKNVIINTGAIIEHDCNIGDHSHIAPGAKVAGGVIIGSGAHIGIGVTIIQGKKIGSNALIGAGAVVIHDIPDNAVVVGVPGKVIKIKQAGEVR